MSKTDDNLRGFPVERVHGITREAFDYYQSHGLEKPVIVTDALHAWRAPSKWTFDLFKSKYGDSNVIPQTFSGTKFMKIMKLRDYIDYLDSPEKGSPGFWIDPTTRFPCEPPDGPLSTPLYLAWNAFSIHPELLEDVELSPTFVEDWLPLLPPAFHKVLDGVRNYFSAGLLIGPKGSITGLHQDVLHTHAYLAQILGRKRCVLFSPTDSGAIHEGDVDPDRPNLQEFPLFRQATAFECILEPGEMLFIPSQWWHQVVSIEKSITVNYNFFNRVNFSAYLIDVLRELPAVLQELEARPDSVAALGIDWVCRGFDFTNAGN